MQKAPKSIRLQAFTMAAGFSGIYGNVFVDVDITNCFPTLMWNALVDCIGEEGAAEFDVFRCFVQFPQVWKDFLGEYFDVDAAD
eukprot:10959791-Heterocapsa_arctica.AAC.1